MGRWRVQRPLVHCIGAVEVFTCLLYGELAGKAAASAWQLCGGCDYLFTCLLYGEVAGTAATRALHRCGRGVYLSTVRRVGG